MTCTRYCYFICANVSRIFSFSSTEDTHTHTLQNSKTMEEISKYLPVDNQFFTGGIGIAALGVAATFARKFSASVDFNVQKTFHDDVGGDQQGFELSVGAAVVEHTRS